MDVDTLVLKYGQQFMDEVWKDLPDSQYGNLESMYLYAYMREYKPRFIFELGTASEGRSTFIIQKAMVENGGGLHTICDVPPVGEEAIANLAKHFPVYNTRLLSGPVEQMGQFVDMNKVEFLFIDADHKRPFANWYMDKLIPRLNDGDIVHIHDMPKRLYGSKQYPKKDSSEFSAVMNRLEDGTASLKTICFLDDWKQNKAFKEKHDALKDKFPIIGSFHSLELPESSSSAYFEKIAGGR